MIHTLEESYKKLKDSFSKIPLAPNKEKETKLEENL